MNRKGFTLIEVLVVIAIIAIVGFGAVTIAQSVIEKTKVSKTETVIRTLVAVLEQYQIETGGYPQSTYVSNITLNDNSIINFNCGYKGPNIATMYNELSQNLKCRPMLEGLPQDCVIPLENCDWDGSGTIESIEKTIVAIVDGWHAEDEGNDIPLTYTNRGNGNFPVIRSAGKDRIFNTADDIISSEL